MTAVMIGPDRQLVYRPMITPDQRLDQMEGLVRRLMGYMGVLPKWDRIEVDNAGDLWLCGQL